MKRDLVVSLIGRPNVGKSSLFNALMKRQNKALTYDRPGVTRDRHYGIGRFSDLAKHDEQDVILVDTGGFYPEEVDETKGKVQDKQASKFFNIMTKHAEMAIAESDLVLFVVDIREGVLPFDQGIADYIRSQKKEFWLVVNKYDTDKQAGLEAEFYSLGVDELRVVSAAHGLGLTSLRESIHQKAVDFQHKNQDQSLLNKGVTPREDVVARLALIGAPNAGKSTLLNQLIGAERALVSDIPGTTIDPIEGYFDLYFGARAKELDTETNLGRHNSVLFNEYENFRKNNPDVFDRMLQSYEEEEEVIRDEEYDESFSETCEEEFSEEINKSFEQAFSEDSEVEENEEREEAGNHWRSIHLVDTAGIRKKSAISDIVENQSVFRSLRSISESDIVLFLIDSQRGMSHQDRRLLDIALEKGKSVIVLLNKIDLLKEKLKTDKERREWIENLRIDIPWLSFCDIIPISAKYNKGLKKLRDIVVKTIMVRRKTVPTSELNRAVLGLVEGHPVVVKQSGGKRFKVKYASMIKSGPPTFLFFTNKSKGIPEHYKRYLKNGLRRNFDFDNTPIHIIFRTGADLAKRMKKVKQSL